MMAGRGLPLLLMHMDRAETSDTGITAVGE